ncbi:MAG TPA: alpha/beta hydrolase [Trinickia sp.]|uniref:alpha/beta fold hydrolase n=1 Tax=Trinickia sp. TaxID=2571163 RepID=UPI002F3F9F92
MSTKVRQIDLDGTPLHYVDEGHGSPIVFVHGYVSDERVWRNQHAAFARSHRYIGVTQRYFGLAPWPDSGERFSLDTHVEDLAALIRALGAGPVDVVGWSYGASLSLELAARHPECVRSLFAYEPANLVWLSDRVAQETAAKDRGEMVGPALAALARGDTADAVRQIFDHAHGRPGLFDTLPSDMRRCFLDNARTVALLFGTKPLPGIDASALGSLTMPIAIAHGALTRPFYRIVAEGIAARIASARLVVLPNGMHAAPVLDAAQFNATVAEFLHTAQADGAARMPASA